VRHSHLRRRLFLLASAAPPSELAPSTQPEGLAKRVAAGLPPSPLSYRVRANVRRSFSFSCWARDSGRRRRLGDTRADPVGVRPQQRPGAWLAVHAASSRVAALAALDPARERLQEAGSGSAGGKRTWRRRRDDCARRPWSMRPVAFGGGAWS
jgi:hypothetical protein